MTHIVCTFPSVCMETDVTLHLLTPTPSSGLMPVREPLVPKGGFPTLYLLHGMGDSAESWLLHSRIASLCEQYRIAVVIPSCGNSFYADDPHGPKTFSYITSELLEYTRAMFPLSQRREDTFLAGYSMGGYGAVRIGLLCPQLFSKVASLSGTLDLNRGAGFARICGYSLPSFFEKRKIPGDSPYDIFFCLDQAEPAQKSFPLFYAACGKEDYFLDSTVSFCEQANAKGLSVLSKLSPGNHNWDYWDPALTKALKWIMAA